MQHPASQKLVSYWNRLRGSRPAPDRANVDPGAIRDLLGDTFILEENAAEGYPFRLAGTRMCALFGEELKHRPFCDLFDNQEYTRITSVLGSIQHDFSVAICTLRGVSRTGREAEFELVALPLRHKGPGQGRMMGALVPLAWEYWMGTDAIAHLFITSSLFLHPEQEIGDPIPLSPLLPAATSRKVRHFTVYEGGRAEIQQATLNG